MANFQQDLAIGKLVEKYVGKIFEDLGFEVEYNNDRYIKWDIRIKKKKKNYTIEIKFDKFERRSGNLAFEIFNPKKNTPSGVYITEANLWCHVISPEYDKYEVYICSTRDLRTFLNNIKPDKVVLHAGDGNATLKLYNKYKVLKILLKPLTKYTICKLKIMQ